MASNIFLDNLEIWLSLSLHEQDILISQIDERLGNEFRYLFLRSYSNHEALRIPTFQHLPSGLEFNLIFGGSYLMGLSADEMYEAIDNNNEIGEADLAPETMRPVHWVQVKPFLISRFPILTSFARQYANLDQGVVRMMPDNPADTHAFYLTRDEAKALAARFHFDLPSEAQWEYACRGNTRSAFYFGNSLPDEDSLVNEILMHDFHDPEQCLRAANPFGLVGLSVGEWCKDSYCDNFSQALDTDMPIQGGPPYVVRGGATLLWPWQGCGEWKYCLSAKRFKSNSFSALTSVDTWAVRFVRKIGS